MESSNNNNNNNVDELFDDEDEVIVDEQLAATNQVKGRNICFTSYGTYLCFDVMVFPRLLAYKYFGFCIASVEMCPRTNRLHIQGYMQFKQPVRYSVLKNLIDDQTAHCKFARGTAQQNVNYCSKEFSHFDGPWTLGQITLDKPGKRNDFDKFIQGGQENVDFREIALANSSTFARYSKGCQRLYEFAQQKAIESSSVRFEKVEVIVFFGAPGTGKSRKVREIVKPQELYIVPAANSSSKDAPIWFDNYFGQPTILLEDFNGNFEFRLLLRLLDGYTGEFVGCKGSFVLKRWRRVYITSNLKWECWYPTLGDTDLNALKRRITQVEEFSNKMEI